MSFSSPLFAEFAAEKYGGLLEETLPSETHRQAKTNKGAAAMEFGTSVIPKV